MPHYKQVMLLRFPPASDREDLATVFEAYDDLPSQVYGVVQVAAGPYTSPEGLNKGYTHAIVITFADENARDAFLDHPLHEKLRQTLTPLLAGGLADLLVFDFKDCNRFLY
ncbi:MAG TPA: stress responsive protein [Planctomycetaceae bacterium]|jgi:hypothetical protein|nr:stress responsive protein [Planctomycetaceae bacterium]